MRAWIDRTNDGLSGMPADGISLPPKKGGTSARPAGAGSKIRLHQPRGWVEEGIAACDVVDGRPLPAHKLVRRYVRNWWKLILGSNRIILVLTQSRLLHCNGVHPTGAAVKPRPVLALRGGASENNRNR